MTLVDVLLLIPSFPLGVVTAVLFCECAAALVLPSRLPPHEHFVQPRLALLIPAHNEALTLPHTLDALLAQIHEGDTVLVVADNCTDATADLARARGVRVLERIDPHHRGKGYALTAGLQALAADPPDVVLMVDADCTMSPGAAALLAARAHAEQRPIQADYLVQGQGDDFVSAVTTLAFLIKNQVRAEGCRRMGLPYRLTGSGMALPWAAAAVVPLLGDCLAEDLWLGIRLAQRGFPATFEPRAHVTSPLPTAEAGYVPQRERWEHGVLGVMLREAPALLWQGTKTRSLGLVALALDLLVPPLALLGALLTLQLLVTSVGAMLGTSAMPLCVGLLEAAMLASAVGLAWLGYGRITIPPRTFLMIPRFVRWKIPIYLAFFRGRRAQRWTRTARDGEADASPPARHHR